MDTSGIICYYNLQLLRNTVIPEAPMFKPEYPPQDGKPEDRVEVALKCLPQYDPASCWSGDSTPSFRYRKILDYAYANRCKIATPPVVAEHIISIIEEFSNKKPPQPLLISFNPEDVRNQAAASTKRFEEGNPLSILDGIFVAVNIDCFPHPSKAAFGSWKRNLGHGKSIHFPCLVSQAWESDS
ncbi:fatty acid amide hydrolase-like [Prunus yedoensis var. nudiflora]|uniref:Fatty acid amide hydrolase-like n=1 Tax=Prunus yedoensis var. nudiflora TaxID=2094558 RepID=A0A314YTX7_PRUYE|nr:fatty acid amide hydrolase-like [Prunus yedoensis var. nudiflora]